MVHSQARAVTIVEDDPSMSQALQRVLRLGGFQADSYTSAEALLSVGAAPTASCLVIDVELPGMNGFALLRRLAERGGVPPVVFISAFNEAAATAEAATFEASAFLAKPFRGRALLETIDRLLAAGQMDAGHPIGH